MTKEKYETHKQTLLEGKIVVSNGRTASTLNELDTLRDIEGKSEFGTRAENEEVMAIDSGRLSPESIAEYGPEHPVIVAAQRLTIDQMDALVNHIAAPLAQEADDANAKHLEVSDQLQEANTKLQEANTKLQEANTKLQEANTKLEASQATTAALQQQIESLKADALKAKPIEAESNTSMSDVNLSDDPNKQAVQAQMATEANDALTPKTVLDNKTDAPTPAGKNASKPAADAAQDQEKAAAKTGA